MLDLNIKPEDKEGLQEKARSLAITLDGASKRQVDAMMHFYGISNRSLFFRKLIQAQYLSLLEEPNFDIKARE